MLILATLSGISSMLKLDFTLLTTWANKHVHPLLSIFIGFNALIIKLLIHLSSNLNGSLFSRLIRLFYVHSQSQHHSIWRNPPLKSYQDLASQTLLNPLKVICLPCLSITYPIIISPLIINLLSNKLYLNSLGYPAWLYS